MMVRVPIEKVVAAGVLGHGDFEGCELNRKRIACVGREFGDGHHVTRTGAPSLIPNMAEAFSSTIANSNRPVEPTWAMSVIGG